MHAKPMSSGERGWVLELMSGDAMLGRKGSEVTSLRPRNE